MVVDNRTRARVCTQLQNRLLLRSPQWLRLLLLFWIPIVLVAAQPATAHETDQYTLPPQRRFAEMGPYLTRTIYDAIAKGAEVQNNRIRSAVNSRSKATEIEKLQSADDIAATVNAQFPVALFFIEGMDRTMLATTT